MRQILVEEFDYEDLPTLLRQMADWLEQEKPKVWSLDFVFDEDYSERWAASIFCFPPPPTPET